MAVMYSFCRYFSVRLGTILVAISSMIQSLILCGLCLMHLSDVRQTSEEIEDWSSSNKLYYVTDLFQSIYEYTAVYLQSATVFLMLHISTCGLLIYAAYKCNIPLTWPYLVMEFLRLAVFSFILFTAMKLVKENMPDLGLLIALSLSGGFLLLGLYYKWFCVFSLCQCIRELETDSPDSQESLKVSDENLLASDFKHLAKGPRQRLPPASPTWGLQAVQHLRNRDYQYGNLGWPTN